MGMMMVRMRIMSDLIVKERGLKSHDGAGIPHLLTIKTMKKPLTCNSTHL